MRDTQPVSQNQYGDDVHPAFGMVQVNRHTVTPGAVLFDSDLRHGHTVVLSIMIASRKRDLNRDWIHSGREVVAVEMSEAQWASLVSSMGTSGVPATLRRIQGERMPDLEYDPRLAHSMDEVKTAAARTFDKIQEAVKAYEALDSKATAKEKRAAFAKIQSATQYAAANIDFATKSLTEHAENVVQRSRADIEAMALQASEEMGLPQSGTRTLELEI